MNPIILVCDDDRLVLLSLSGELRRAGYEVIEADNGDDAILLARQHRPQLAILDVRMDGKSGMDVAAYLRDYVGTPFMFLSAFGEDGLVRQAAELGALQYLVKPIELSAIVPAVEAALSMARERSATKPAGGTATVDALIRAGTPESAVRPPSAEDGLIAIGILMERYRMTREAANNWLADLARRSGRTIEEVAAELVGQMDRWHSVDR